MFICNIFLSVRYEVTTNNMNVDKMSLHSVKYLSFAYLVCILCSGVVHLTTQHTLTYSYRKAGQAGGGGKSLSATRLV